MSPLVERRLEVHAAAESVARAGGIDIRADEHAQALRLRLAQVRADRLRGAQQEELPRERVLEVCRRETEARQGQFDLTGAPRRRLGAEQYGQRRIGAAGSADRHFTRDQ